MVAAPSAERAALAETFNARLAPVAGLRVGAMILERRIPALIWGTAGLLVLAVIGSAALLLGRRKAEALAASEVRLARLVARPMRYPGLWLSASLRLGAARDTGHRHSGWVLGSAGGFIAMLLLAAGLGHAHLRRLQRARSQQDAAERALAQAKLAAEAAKVANQAKSRFLATMSHEMRSPLNPAQQRQAGLIRSSGQALMAVLNDILAISREIVQLMGGQISVHSELGVGSCFTVDLCLASTQLPLRAAGAGQPLPPDAALGAAPLRILVAEDNAVNQLLIKALLDAFGHDSDVVGNGLEALHQVQASHYDLLLMDIQMPEMDGVAATLAIRALAGAVARIPILAMTANVMSEQALGYSQAGMDGVIAKPIDPAELDAAIRGAVRPAPVAGAAPDPPPTPLSSTTQPAAAG